MLQAGTQISLIDYIYDNPVHFLWDPKSVSNSYTVEELRSALEYFSQPQAALYTHSVCTALLNKRYAHLDSELFSSGLSEYRENRFWPFWDKSASSDLMVDNDLDTIESLLLNLWNQPGNSAMFWQTGFLQVVARRRFGPLLFFKCELPMHKRSSTKPHTLTIVFDAVSKAFYSMNAKIKSADSDFRFRYIEYISPKVSPPKLENIFRTAQKRRCNVLFVLDRHIGDNLSLFSTHLRYLVGMQNVDLTLDVSMCPFFKNVPSSILNRLLPAGSAIKIIDHYPDRRAQYDLVIDPYDWVSGVFDIKPQNDSGAISIVSALEFALCCKENRRRDILDIHMQSLKRMGIVPREEPIPQFLRYRITPAERENFRRKIRVILLKGRLRQNNTKIVTIFPFGYDFERRYPAEGMQTILANLIQYHDVRVFIAGTDYDTSEIVASIRSDWSAQHVRSDSDVVPLMNEPLKNLIDLMLASDVVVSMDSGPLHLARALRVKPIGLYTKKVNDPDLLLSFPWLVEDGTVEVMKPEGSDEHVLPKVILEAIRRRLDNQQKYP